MIEEVDGNTKQKDANVDTEQNHESGQVVVSMNHGHDTKRRAEGDDVFASDDNDESRSRVLGESFRAEMGGRDQHDDEAKFVECPSHDDAPSRMGFRIVCCDSKYNNSNGADKEWQDQLYEGVFGNVYAVTTLGEPEIHFISNVASVEHGCKRGRQNTNIDKSD